MEVDMINLGRIGVLMGGPSSEREVSLKSGAAVYEALRTVVEDVVAIDIKTSDLQENRQLIQREKIAMAFITLHGNFGEDGQIQAMLEGMNIPYTGSGPAASNLAMDKIISRRIFQQEGLPVPKYFVLTLKDDRETLFRLIQEILPPFVIKPATQGSSIGLSIIDSQDQLEDAIKYAFRFDERVIIEEYIPGREITVGILGDSALPVLEIIPQNKFYDYEAKYKTGKSSYVVPADLPANVSIRAQNIAQTAHRLLGCYGFSRVDLRLDPAGIPFVLEVNSIPGLTSLSLLPKAAGAVGVGFSELCIRILHLAYERMIAEKSR